MKALSLSLLLWAAACCQAASPWDDARTVTRAQISAALREQQAQGYRLDAIANSVRLHTAVFLKLAAQEQAAGSTPRALRIGHADWLAAYVEVTGLKTSELPAWVEVPHRLREDYLVDGRIDTVLDIAASADRPRAALRVTAGWPVTPDAPPQYSFEDRSTDPAIETTRLQVNGYVVFDYGDAVVVDGIHGVTGRATSGLLGAIFSVIGHARAVQTRFAIAADGTQVSRTTARKGLTLTQAIAILPDGRVQPALPPERADLAAVDTRLAALPLRVVLRPAALVPPP